MIKLETLSQDQRDAVQSLLMEAGYPMTCETYAVWLLQNHMGKELEDIEGLALTTALIQQIPLAASMLGTRQAPITKSKVDLGTLRMALEHMLTEAPYRTELEHLPQSEWGPYIDAYLPTVLEVVSKNPPPKLTGQPQ